MFSAFSQAVHARYDEIAKMIDSAVAELRELGLEGAVSRRMAKIEDVSVNDVLFVDNSQKSKMRDGLAGLLMESVKPRSSTVPKNATAISADDFITTVLPKAVQVDVLVQKPSCGKLRHRHGVR